MPRDLDCTRLVASSLLPRSKTFSTQPKFSVWMRRESLKDDSQIRFEDTKKFLMRERVWCHEILIPCCTSVLLLSIFFDFPQLALKSLYFSVALCEGWLWFFLIRISELKSSSTKWQSPSQNWSMARNNHPFLANWTDWEVSFHFLLWLLSSLSVHLSFGFTAPFGRSSASFESSFIHSLSLPVLSKTQLLVAFSLHAGALSHWHSLPQ